MTSHTKLSILALAIATFTIGIDFTGALLLVPPIENEFTADITTTQWVLNIYVLTFAVFMVAGGRLGDMYGRRRLMLIGFAVFLVASAGCWLAPSMAALIGARAMQGVGAALLWPNIVGAAANVSTEDDRGMVMGLIMAGVTTGNVCGPLISGFMVALGDWRLFFLANVIMAIVAGLMTIKVLPKEPPAHTNERIDYAGIVVLGGASLALLYALDAGADWGWLSLPILGLIALSIVLYVAFPLVEHKVTDPMVPLPLMHNREFQLALLANALVVPPVFIAFLYFPQFMQKVLGWTVLQSSYGMVPMLALLAVTSVLGGRLYKPVGPKRLLLGGYALTALGAASVVVIAPSWGYFAILPAMLLMGLSSAVTVGTSATAAVSAVAPQRAGVAGGLSFSSHLIFGALCVAGATAVMYAIGPTSLRQKLAQAGISMTPADLAVLNGSGADSEAGARVLAQFGRQADVIQTALADAFARGMSYAFWIGLVTAVAGFLAVMAIDEKELQKVKG